MPDATWEMQGDYVEACNCDFLCPCITSNQAAKPTHGECKVAMIFKVDRGHYGQVLLDELCFAVMAQTPGPMAEGNWTVGLVVDGEASADQCDALVDIVAGKAGGPMAAVAPLVGTFAGVERAPIRFEKEGLSYRVVIPGIMEQAIEGMPSPSDPAEPIVIDNTIHPVNARLGLGTATSSHLHAFGIDWDDDSGRNNAHMAPFLWTA